MRELLGLRRDEVHHTNIESFQVHNGKNARFGLDTHPFLIFGLSLPGTTVDNRRTSMQSGAGNMNMSRGEDIRHPVYDKIVLLLWAYRSELTILWSKVASSQLIFHG